MAPVDSLSTGHPRSFPRPSPLNHSLKDVAATASPMDITCPCERPTSGEKVVELPGVNEFLWHPELVASVTDHRLEPHDVVHQRASRSRLGVGPKLQADFVIHRAGAGGRVHPVDDLPLLLIVQQKHPGGDVIARRRAHPGPWIQAAVSRQCDEV